MTPRLLSLLIALGFTGAAQAQDTRDVKEPALPPACAVLTGDLFAPERNDAPRIQAAIDACAPGHAVVLAASNARGSFVSGPLVLKSGVTLVVDAGATLYASSDARLFDRGAAEGKTACGSNDQNGRGCRPLLAAENTRGSGIMGRGAIDGRGGEKILGKEESWWQLARRAQKEKTRQNVPRLIQVDKSQDFTMYGILLKNSPNFHVTLNQVDGFTAWGVKIDTPHDARNTDGIDPISSRNVTIAHSWIRTGDDNVAIKGGSNGPTENVSILHNHFYSGHGMSIGSETNGGVRRVLVEDLDMDGTTSGLRVKSNDTRGGTVSEILYRNVCLRATRAPIDIYTHYEQADKPGSLVPDYRDIRMERVHSLTPGTIKLQGYDEAHPLRLRLADVVVAGKPVVKTEFAQVSGSASFLGEAAAAVDCSGRFPAFPIEPARNPRPQLSAGQAQAYALKEVLQYAGPLGAERIDPWDPLADPLATGAAFTPDYTVDAGAPADGVTRFASVQAALNRAVAAAGGRRVHIRIRPGVYRELLYVPAGAPPITLAGDAADPRAVRIVASLDAATSGADYRRRHGAEFEAAPPAVRAMYEQLKDLPVLSTFGSATAWVKADGFQARALTIENDFNREGSRTQAECVGDRCPDNTGGSRVHHQAVALRVDGADRVQFENVRLLGLQDTLFLNSADGNSSVRSFFHKSYVEGDVDFIFGDAIAYFEDCEVKSIGDRGASYALAPDTSRRAKYGFVFNRCRFTSERAAGTGGNATQFYLARQWFHNQRCTPYGSIATDGYRCRLGDADVYRAPEGTIRRRTLESVGKAVILNSRIGAHIDRANPWSEWNRNGTLAHRPAQFSSDDYWANLHQANPAVGLDAAAVLDGTAPPSPAEIYLGEYNNTNE